MNDSFIPESLQPKLQEFSHDTATLPSLFRLREANRSLSR